MKLKYEIDPNDAIAFFQRVVTDAFEFLVTDYGFSHTSTEIELDWDDSEICIITYRNSVCEITPAYQRSGNFVSCGLARLERSPDGFPEEAEVYDIDYLIKVRCPDKMEDQQFEKNSAEDIVRIINTYADVLKVYGRDLFVGDRELFRELLSVRETEQKEAFENGAVLMITDETGETKFYRDDDSRKDSM